MKQRVDQLLVDRGLADSKQKAQALILAGSVLVKGHKAMKAGQMVDDGSPLEVVAKQPFVSRGGLKLEAGLREFDIDVEGRVCADIGSSTGGFTDCLLQRGAQRVHAVDVGHGQLDWKLRNDPRVVVHEGVNARYLKPEVIGEACGLVVCDVSFISLALILPAILPLLDPAGEFVVLVKPQFEAGRDQVGKGGIVRDAALHEAAVAKAAGIARHLGFTVRSMPSPIAGAAGNREFLLYGCHH